MALAFFEQDPENDDYYDASSTGILKKSASRLIGLGLGVLAVALYFVFATYSVDDPSMLNVSDRDPENALGFLGAYLADPLFRVLGQAVWVMPLVAAIWAFRFFFDFGAERGSTRSIFIPIAMIFAAAFASTGIPDYTWPFAKGLGGEFGDMILGGLIRVTPLPNGLSLFIWTVLLGVFTFASIAYVSGATLLGIARRIDRIIMDTRNFGLFAIGGASTLFGRASKSVADMRETRREQKALAYEASYDDNASDIGAEQTGLRTKLGGFTTGFTSGLGAKLRREKPIEDESHFEIDNSTLEAAVANAHQFQPTGDPVKDAINSVVARRVGEHRQKLGEYDINIGKGTMLEDSNAPALGGLSADRDAIVPKDSLVQAPSKKITESKRAKAEKEPELAFEPKQPSYEMPPLMLLQNPAQIERRQPSQDALEANARLLESVLDDYGVKGEIIAVRPGPVVTLYELEPAAGLKASRVIGLADDIARSMSALTARVSTIPGRSVIGIELPNEHREMVLLREIFGAKAYGDTKSPLPLALGKDIGGEPIVANLAKMPHLLIAGTTGSGKSVAINTMILSLLYQLKPEECRLIMIDPKMLELSVYDGIPHLLSPVVTDPKKAVVALKWVVQEMEERYRKMSKMGVRNIDGYNARVKDALTKGEDFERVIQTGFDDATGEPVFETESYSPETMPYIVVIVDEMADLMMVAGKEIEACIQRLAQMARASGIHLIMATQRPSVDVITGTIKANFPTRISFQVTSKIDSRTILGEMGAEQLLGQGDMLYMAGGGRITRVHAPFVSDEEVEEVVQHLKLQGEPEYLSSVIEGPEDDKAAADIDAVLGLSNGNSDDELYDQAVMIVARDRKASTSYIQRKLSIGYNKAAKIIERMEEENVVSEANHVGKRDVLVPEI